MLESAQRAARAGAKMTAIVSFGFALALAAWESVVWTTGDWSRFLEIALTHGAAALVAGAIAGLVLFGLIGFVATGLGFKRVGWTFVYSLLGALLFAAAAYWIFPSLEAASPTLAGAGVAAAIALAALNGALSGYLVADALKNAPEI